MAATLLAGAALGLSAPAAAQLYSDGYKFLEAVKEKNGDDATNLISQNSTIVNARDVASGETGLHIATKRRDLTWIEYLIQQGANPNIRDNRGVSPLALAVQSAFHEGAAQLLKAGARVDDANDAGETPLIYAVHRNDEELMKILLEAGADPNRSDNSGRSALDYAKENNSRIALDAIESYAEPDAGEDGVYGPVF
jgi:ankyrin repeat protein